MTDQQKMWVPCERCGTLMKFVRVLPQLGPGIPEVLLFQCSDCTDARVMQADDAARCCEGQQRDRIVAGRKGNM
jgi:hypothetical protein